MIVDTTRKLPEVEKDGNIGSWTDHADDVLQIKTNNSVTVFAIIVPFTFSFNL